MLLRWAEATRAKVHLAAESLGNLLVETFHYLSLLWHSLILVETQ